MLRKYLLYGICGCLLALGGCNKNEEEVSFPSNRDLNWFVVKDKPGELNQLLYSVYRELGMTIFVNDTIGLENYAMDASGNPIYRWEYFDIGYTLFGNTKNQGNEFDVEKYVIKSSVDTSAMILATELIRDKVLPYIPKSGACRPKCYLLLDSLCQNYSVSSWTGLLTYKIDIPTYVALKGVAVGKLWRITEMTEDERNLWCGEIIASKVAEWLISNMDLTEWYKITDEGGTQTWYNWSFGTWTTQFKADIVECAGIFDWFLETETVKITYTQEIDVREYVARIYAYRGRENEFLVNYDENSKVYRKFQLMRTYVDAFEETFGLK